MAYALIPEGFELKKVTKLQEEAVNAHKRHENILALLGNEKVPQLLLGGIAIASLPIVIPVIISALAKQIPGIPEGAEEAVDTLTFIKDLNEAIGEIIVPGGGILFEGEAKDFYDKYVKK